MSEGRPTDYRPEFPEQAEKLCQLGATDIEMADFFGVTDRTIYHWKIIHPEFCASIKVGKDAADERVKRALYQRAVGYSIPTEKVFQYQGDVVRAETREHVPADPGAAMNWLKNRQPSEWRDKREIEHSMDDDLAARLMRARTRIADLGD